SPRRPAPVVGGFRVCRGAASRPLLRLLSAPVRGVSGRAVMLRIRALRSRACLGSAWCPGGRVAPCFAAPLVAVSLRPAWSPGRRRLEWGVPAPARACLVWGGCRGGRAPPPAVPPPAHTSPPPAWRLGLRVLPHAALRPV